MNIKRKLPLSLTGTFQKAEQNVPVYLHFDLTIIDFLNTQIFKKKQLKLSKNISYLFLTFVRLDPRKSFTCMFHTSTVPT